MRTRQGIEKLLHENYSHLAKEYGVKKLGLFGSYAKGSPTPNSDVDVIVEFEQPLGLKFIEFGEDIAQSVVYV